MSSLSEDHISPSFRKVLKFVAFRMLLLVAVAVCVIGFRDWQVLIPLVVMLAIMTLIFTVVTRSMLSFTINNEGIMGPFFIMKWENISKVKKSFMSPFYRIQTKGVFAGRGSFIPSQRLLGDKDSLMKVVSKYAPAEHVILSVIRNS